MQKIRWIALACCIIPSLCGAQQLRSISVSSAWGGLGTPADSQLRLKVSGDKLSGDKTTVPLRSGIFLITALREPIIDKPSAANLGIDAEWLRTHMEIAGENASMLWYKDGTPAQKKFFAAKFMDQSTLPSRLERVYNGFHTDDYPSMKVQIDLEDGTAMTAFTSSQNPLMLPWCIGADEKHCVATYNAHISQALYDILPEQFANRGRLLDSNSFGGLAPQMGLYMAGGLEREWNLIGVQDKDAATLEELKKHFTVKNADINTWNGLAFNEIPNTGKHVDENLGVTLWRSGFPPHFVISALLLREKGASQGVSELPEKANHYAETVLSVRWLEEFFRTHPDEGAFLMYVHGVSMTDKAMRIFSKDMQAAKHKELIPIVEKQQSEAALLETGGGDWWIILPDHSMILWRWTSSRPILKWPNNTFPATRCTAYEGISGGCAGIIISPEGNIVH